MSSSNNNNKRRRIDGYTRYGPPKKELSEIKTLRFEIANFKNLNEQNGEYVQTDQLEAHNHSWRIVFFPRGVNEQSNGYVSYFLHCTDANYLHCTDSSETKPFDSKLTVHDPISVGSAEHTFKEGYGYPQVGSHRYILENCLNSDGSFIIDVDIQVYVEKKSVWYPKKTKKIDDHSVSLGMKLYKSLPDEADISFLVGCEEHQPKERFNAHKNVLLCQAPVLYDFIKSVPNGGEFEIPDVSIPAFKILLGHIYTGQTPNNLIKKDDNTSNDDDGEDETTTRSDDTTSVSLFDYAKSVLIASNRYGLVDMKLYVESEIISKLLKIENAAEWLPIADGQVCPLLKEYCMNMFLKDPTKFKSSKMGWNEIQESSHLLVELLDFSTTTTTTTNNGDSGGSRIVGNDNDDDDDDYNNMSVTTLREKLESNDLDLDGTKLMLIERLYQSSYYNY